MSTKSRLVALLASTVLVGVVVAVSLSLFRQIETSAAERQYHYQVLLRANVLLVAMLDAETGERGFALTGDEAFLAPYLAARDGVTAQLRVMRQLALSDAARQHLDAVSPLLDAKLSDLAQVIALRRADDVPGVTARVANGEGKRLMDALRQEMAGFVNLENTVVAERDARYQSTMRLLLAIIAVATLLTLVSAVAFAYLTYRGAELRLRNAAHLETARLLKLREEAAAQLQLANLTLQASEEKLAVTLNSIGDAVIATDADERVTLLNPVAEALTGWLEADAVGRRVAEVFHVINQDTRQPSPIPITEALAHGTIQGLANHTVLISRDGHECPIADSCAPIRDRSGSVVGAVMVFRDVTEEHAAQRAVADSGVQIQTILNTAVDGIITLHADDGLVATANPAAERMFGYGAAELVGRGISLLIPELADGRHQGSLDQYCAKDHTRPAGLGREVVGRRQDGSLLPIEISVSEMWLGGARYFTGMLRDCSARKAAEEALQKAGALQSAIFNSANFSSIATDAKGVIQIFNVGAERMLGYAAADVMNQITPADISDPQELIARAEALSGELATPITPGFEALVFKASRGIEDIYELTYIRKDGSRFPAVVSVTALRDAQNGIIGYLLIGTDNTARKQVEEERGKLDQRLRDQHFYTRSLIESNIDALMTTDPRGIITDVNKQTEALTGCTRDELIGAPFKNYFTDPSRAEAGINRVLTEGKVTNYELTARARDGTLTVVSYNATTFHDRERSLQGVFAAARDVTELKRYEQTLQQKNVELEGASRMKSEFLANMSHELRTPLNAIIGFSEVLRDGLMGELTAKQRGFVGDIFSSGTHLLSLINDILDLSKVEAGKLTLDLEPVEVSTVFANSLAIVRERAARTHIRLDIEAAEELGSIQADARKVKQIVYNLVSNAVKFTTDGGQVTLTAGRVPRSEVGHLSGRWTGRSFPLADSEFANFLKISVTDTGIGIGVDGLGRLFEPFSQIDSGLARKFEGTGLGLVLVKVLTELHGGTVAVESAAGEGSCFTVWLPLRAADEGARALARAPSAAAVDAPTGVRTALVVENDDKAADLIRVQLEAEGFKVLHVASAEEALAVAGREPLSLITLDILLPKMDGWELLTRLKQVPELGHVPVVIISIVADRSKGFALGASAVMQKPISRQTLYESLVELSLFPTTSTRPLNVLVVDDDPKAVELIVLGLHGLAGSVSVAYGGADAIDAARRELPDVIVLDLMMPDVNGFDVVEALKQRPETARIPVIVVTAKQVTAEDRASLDGFVTSITEKTDFDGRRFTAEVRRAMSGRGAVA